MQETPAIEVEDLAKTYREGLIFRKKFQALKGVSFQVKPGEIFGLLGPNGAGKTTFVKILLGIIRKTSGRALMLGRPAGDIAGRRRVGYLPEHLRVPRHLNARSALNYFGQLSGLSSADIKPKRDELLELVGLANRAKDSVRKYSKGMLQRLGLAQALLHDPELIFLDEPTDGLDPVGRSDVRATLNQLKDQGKTVFLNSHLLQEVEMICDRVAILNHGELTRIGTLDEVAGNTGEHIDVQFKFDSSPDQIQLALNGRQILDSFIDPDGYVTRVVRFENQNEINHCVDKLRSHDASIVSIARRRVTLEDAFLQLVHQSQQPLDQGGAQK